MPFLLHNAITARIRVNSDCSVLALRAARWPHMRHVKSRRNRSAFSRSMGSALQIEPSPKFNVRVLPAIGVKSQTGSPHNDSTCPLRSMLTGQLRGGGQLGGRKHVAADVIQSGFIASPNSLNEPFFIPPHPPCWR